MLFRLWLYFMISLRVVSVKELNKGKTYGRNTGARSRNNSEGLLYRKLSVEWRNSTLAEIDLQLLPVRSGKNITDLPQVGGV